MGAYGDSLRGKTMASDQNSNKEWNSTFGAGGRERRQANDAANDAATLAAHAAAMSLNVDSSKTSNVDHGSDPYNTSGGFDRKKHWTRVGKR
jgi:hypothetical protein